MKGEMRVVGAKQIVTRRRTMRCNDDQICFRIPSNVEDAKTDSAPTFVQLRRKFIRQH